MRRLLTWLPAVRRWSARRRIASAVVLLLLVGAVTWSVVAPTGLSGFRTEELTISSGSGPDEVMLDTTIFVPDGVDQNSPAAAVILAHGFGGPKGSMREDAQALAGRGFLVLTYSARGFGASTGQIGLDSPDFEVADARRLIDLLADRSDVVQDAEGDPRVGISGPSYGGALALLAAGYDDRIDAIVPQITWNSMVSAFFPNSVGAPVADTPAASSPVSADGVFKKLWAGLFFASGQSLDPTAILNAQDGAGADGVPDPTTGGLNPVCGRFRPEVCAAYADAATTGRLSPETAALLDRSSPRSVLDRITAPTMLIQGEADTLFPLSEADANARGIAASGTPVKVVWYTGGHDAAGSADDAARLRALTAQWFAFHLRAEGPDPGTGFEYAQVLGLSTTNGRPTSRTTVSDSYPGLDGGATSRTDVALAGPTQRPVTPPGGNPAAISSLPGLTQVTGLLDGLGVDLPGQSAAFQSAAFDAPVQVVGTPTVSVRIAAPDGEAVLFAKLYDVGPDGQATLPQSLVAPTRLSGLPSTVDGAPPVEITLPGIAYRFEVGHSMRLVLATTDQAFQTPVQPIVYGIALAGSDAAISVPTVDGTPLDATTTPWIPFLLTVAGLALLGTAVGWLVLRRRRDTEVSDVDGELLGVPLVATGLTKSYADGFVAVRELSFRVAPGQVVGLLGPNGAGKTTTLRMLMGLISPTEGEFRVFGHRVRAGAPVLSRLGAFVEGTGFLPHLSGADNLSLYWRATGRPAEDAHLEEALEISGLGGAVNKTVRTYSQGMRQRLAIAQSMLGLPDLLVLDEPTNGLDPPQIREMRQVLRRYVTDSHDGSAAGAHRQRTVLLSSHLLAEVEQTCTHVVVMDRGRLITQGTVGEVVGESSSVLIGVDDDAAAVRVLSGLPGVDDVHSTADGVVAELNGTERAVVVRELVEAGVGVQRFMPRRRLEDVFISLIGEGRHDVG